MKYKAGDKVYYDHDELLTTVIGQYSQDTVQVYSRHGVDIIVSVDDLRPYITAHERMLELGFKEEETSKRFTSFINPNSPGYYDENEDIEPIYKLRVDHKCNHITIEIDEHHGFILTKEIAEVALRFYTEMEEE